MKHLAVLFFVAVCFCLHATAFINIHKLNIDWDECETTILPRYNFQSATMEQYQTWKITMKGKASFDYPTFAANSGKFTCQAIRYLENQDVNLYLGQIKTLLQSFEVNNGSATFSFLDSPFAATPHDVFRRLFMTSNKKYSHDEYRQVSGANKYYDWTQVRPNLVRSSSIPSDFDWNTVQGRVSSPRQQGPFGTCWAFSAAQAMEGVLATINLDLHELSAETNVECDNYSDGTYYADCGYFGGLPSLALRYIKEKHGGYHHETVWPYSWNAETESMNYRPCMSSGYSKNLCGNHDDLYCKKETTHGQGPEDWCNPTQAPKPYVQVGDIIDIARNETLIQRALLQYGPLSVALHADEIGYYKEGIVDFDCSDFLDHAVLITGYGYDETLKKPFWNVKNSWGSDFGESGYFRVVIGKDMCGISQQAVAVTAVAPA